MSDDVTAKLEARKTAIETEFAQLQEQEQSLKEQGAKLNQELSKVRTRQVQLQGSYSEVKELLGEKEESEKKPQKAKK